MPSKNGPPKRHGWRRPKVILAMAGLAVGLGTLVRARGGHSSGHISATGTPRTPPSAEALAHGWEPKDISARDVTIILGVIAASTALVIGIVYLMTWRFDVSRTAAFSHLTSEENARMIPPAPHLQRDPFADLARVKSREQRLLTDYGWINTDHTLAHIPIDRAMALSVGKSLDASP